MQTLVQSRVRWLAKHFLQTLGCDCILLVTAVHPGQNVTLIGERAPPGQLPLLDANLNVMTGGGVTLVSVHLSRPAVVAAGGRLQLSAGSVAERAAEVLRVPTTPPEQIPECSADKGPAMVATMNEDLGMEVLLACTTKRDVSSWKPIVTAGGVIYDGAPV
eukprot:SAG31_NODE_359_length_17032_cov_11.017894_12_plen_161_part_00